MAEHPPRILRLQDRGDEQLGVGVLRIVEHLVGQPGLDHLAVAHHHQPVGQQAGDGEVVGDDDRGQAQVGDQPAQQVEQPRLHRDVEPAGGLVHEHQAGPVTRLRAICRRCCMPPEKVLRGRSSMRAASISTRPASRRCRGSAVVARADRHQPLADIGAGADVHAQAVARVLVDEAPVGAHQQRAAPARQRTDVGPGRRPACVLDAAAGRASEADEAVEQRRLAGARFADDAEHLAGPESKSRRRGSRDARP
jgi:hypothetical protein